MAEVNTILCCCISGLGSSFITATNVKKALKELGREDIKVSHAGVNDAFKGAADLFVCTSDIYDLCSKSGPTIGLDRLTDYDEILTKLRGYFESTE